MCQVAQEYVLGSSHEESELRKMLDLDVQS